MFIYKNPSRKDREKISEKYRYVQWEKFGPACDDEDGLEFLHEHSW